MEIPSARFSSFAIECHLDRTEDEIMENPSASQTTLDPAPRYEQYKVKGEKLLAKARQLVHEGNVRRLIIKNEEGRTIIEAPLTVGVVGAVLAPLWVAIGALAAVVNDCSIEVQRENEA
jgi:hypothetical protein